MLRPPRMSRHLRRLFTAIVVLAILLVGGGLGLLLGIRVEQTRTAARKLNDRHLSLGLVLINYHNEHGCFPPTRVVDEDGKPMHSWRVLLLPYIGKEEEELYNKYDFTEPWDGPHNKALAESFRDGAAPHFYRVPHDEPEDKSWTTFVAIGEAEAAWPRWGRPFEAYQVIKGSSKFLLVDVPNSGIHWMEPRDCDYREDLPVDDPVTLPEKR